MSEIYVSATKGSVLAWRTDYNSTDYQVRLYYTHVMGLARLPRSVSRDYLGLCALPRHEPAITVGACIYVFRLWVVVVASDAEGLMLPRSGKGEKKWR